MENVLVLSRCLKSVLKENIFSEDSAIEAVTRLRNAQEEWRRAEERLRNELVAEARVLMATIGCSGASDENLRDVNDADDVSVSSFAAPNSTLVFFDEAGCIPSYELLGLSRRSLTGIIDAVVLVGDKHQLPPYNPTQSTMGVKSRYQENDRYAFRRGRRAAREDPEDLKSLLDASALTTNDSIILLTRQYRVPRDIAGILNDRVYNGNYKTPPSVTVPKKGFFFIHVPLDQVVDNKKYVNNSGVQRCLDLVEEFRDTGQDDVLILTPKQQREIQFQLKRNQLDEVQVLTIDQCQGHEADIVILSLVQKPTRFLNKNRFNVALSRVRKKLFLLIDRNLFREASRNTSWECACMAYDLLQLSRDNLV